MNRRACASALPLLFAACASAPDPGAIPSPQVQARSSFQVRLASDAEEPSPARIGKTDLDQARTLLSRARKELQPRHWELLDRKLTEAERAWERHAALARTSGKSAELPRTPLPVASFVGIQATAETTAGAALVPLFAILGALWPASVADGTLTPRHAAELELEARLRELVEASRQVKAELETGKRPPGTTITTTNRRSECQPVPVPHLGGDKVHDTCADVVPPNRFPGHDVLIMGKRFDALQTDADVLWEIKTDRFDTYPPYLRRRTTETQVPELQREREIAAACGYGFIVGVSSAAHAEALGGSVPGLQIRLTGC